MHLIQISEPWIYLLYLALDAREYFIPGSCKQGKVRHGLQVLHCYMRPATDLAVERVSGLTSSVAYHRGLARCGHHSFLTCSWPSRQER